MIGPTMELELRIKDLLVKVSCLERDNRELKAKLERNSEYFRAWLRQAGQIP